MIPIITLPIPSIPLPLDVLLSRPREERDWGGKAREGINDTASALFADVKAIYGKAKKTRQATGLVSMRT